MIDVSVVDTAVTTTAMEPHVWHFVIALLATGNSLDVEKYIVVGNSSAADIALADGATVRNAKVDCQQLQMVKRHFMQERRFLIEAEQ